jgi:hypothetical protein
VHSLHITPYAPGRFADGHGTRPAHRFEQLPSFGRKHLPCEVPMITLTLYGCLPDSKENLCRVVKKSAASLYSALFV